MAQPVLTMRYAPTAVRSFQPITLAEAKAQIRQESTDDDDLITAYIASAGDYIERRIQRSLASRTWVVELSRFPDNGGEIVLPVPPIQSITSVAYYTSSVLTALTVGTDYRVNLPLGRIRIGLGKSYWRMADYMPDAVTVTMVAGYATISEIPVAIKQATKLLVGHWYEHREGVSGDAGSAVDLAVSALIDSYWVGEVAL